MNGFRVVVVDDEPLARMMVASLVRRDPEVDSVVECGDALTVADTLAREQPHILFLDIEMPGMDGLQVARLIDDGGPVVVFITAFSQYAARAFDVNAVDYVMKPFSDQRMSDALERAKRRVRERRLGALANQVASLSAELSGVRESPPARDAAPVTYAPRLAFKVGDRAVVLKTEEITWIEAEDYYVLVPLELLERARETRRIFDIVLGSIAGISLVVGGIGIMNIMLATVTERTREIGVRRALGAKRGDITVQFLAEALVLSVLGGAMGVALGLLVPWVVTEYFGMRTLVSPESLALSFGISAFVGVAFGIYPAIRASFLDPIEALRHE